MYSQSSKRNSIMLAKERLSPKKMKNILVWRLGGILVKHYVCSDNVNNLFYYMTIKNKQAFVIGNVSNRASYN